MLLFLLMEMMEYSLVEMVQHGFPDPLLPIILGGAHTIFILALFMTMVQQYPEIRKEIKAQAQARFL